MATTELTAICSTPHLALTYYMADKIEKINSPDEVNKDAPHKIFEENGQLFVKYFTLTTFQNCNMDYPFSSFAERQAQWQNMKYQNNGVKTKNGKEPVMYELRQSFNGWEVPFEVANEIGQKLARELFGDCVVTVSTHGNTGSVHNHIAISAWREDGKKINNCLSLTRQIRKVSDRICDEYGISVLEETREMKVIKWKDENGVTHFYEPTDRKNELIKNRQQGKAFPDDVNSYRNTESFGVWKTSEQDRQDEIKQDIDTLLPSCRSYEELLIRLRDLGYQIRDKKKTGEWMAHISFKAPNHEKATREDKIGDGIFYLRENLERYIAENVRSGNVAELHAKGESKADITYFGDYEYGKTDISKIDFDYKAVIRNGEIKIEKRSEAEQKVISDVVKTDGNIRRLIDTSGIDRVIQEQTQKLSPNEVRAQFLIKQIQESFRCLKYSEQNNIYSYKQIIDLYSASKNKYETTILNFSKAEKAIESIRRILSLPAKVEQLREAVAASETEAERRDNTKSLSETEALLKKYGIDSPEGYKSLQEKCEDFEARQENLLQSMAGLSAQMRELENCVKTFDRIDGELGVRNVEAVRKFNILANVNNNNGDDTAQKTSKQKGRDER